MNAFEHLVAALMERERRWVRTNYKVRLTKEEKRAINRHSVPAWDIDVLAYSPVENHVVSVECKSYLYSYGVRVEALDGSGSKYATYFKLFNDQTLQRIVFSRLASQLVGQGLCPEPPTVQLGLAAGRIYQNREAELRQLFLERSWFLWTPNDIATKVRQLPSEGYEDSVALMVAKILAHG